MNEIEQLEAERDDLLEERTQLLAGLELAEQERDALAAHVEQINRSAYYASEPPVKHVLAMGPEYSLARLKAQWREEAIRMRDDAVRRARRDWAAQASPEIKAEWQVEALNKLARELENTPDNGLEDGIMFAVEAMDAEANEIRRQAEGEQS